MNDLVESFANSSNKLRWNVSTHNFADEFVPCLISLGINRFNIANDPSILSSTSSLLLMQVIKILLL